MRSRPTVLVLIAFLAGGCIEHRAVVDNPSGPAHAAAAGVGIALIDPFAAPDQVAFHAGQPLDLPVDAWRRDEDGAILRWHGRVTTPRAWWQRFPCDAATDLWPTSFVCLGETAIACAAVPARDAGALAAAARRDGYAREPASAATP